ncbi:MAG: acyltransferase [Verrucomicrobiota bacterium]|nr:acyltransferase [Verrucomicrobiota bacterium]
MKKLLALLTLFLPWGLRRFILQRYYGYQIHPTAKIGLAWIFPEQLIMKEFSSIGHLTVCKSLSLLSMGAHSHLGRGNWVTGYPKAGREFFTAEPDRVPELIIGDHSAITNRHIIDCTNSIRIGRFTTMAGFRSQILTHSIDLLQSRQASAPVKIGDYCFLGTDCVVLGGSVLPDYCVLGAKSLLRNSFEQPRYLYAGVPARPVKPMDSSIKYFERTTGFVY